jgi:hypothetical protein
MACCSSLSCLSCARRPKHSRSLVRSMTAPAGSPIARPRTAAAQHRPMAAKLLGSHRERQDVKAWRRSKGRSRTSERVTSRTACERGSWSRPESVAAMIQRFAHVCFRKLGSIINSPGATLPMNTGRSVCDLNRHTLSLSNTHSLIKSATIGAFDCCFDGPP